MSHLCPHCRCPLGQPGRYVQGNDEAGLFFVFALCVRCSRRLDRLPIQQQLRSHDRAARLMATRPGRYLVKTFSEEVAARAYCMLEAEAAR